MIENGLCYSCFRDETFQFHGMTATYQQEIDRYTSSLQEGLQVKCRNCERAVVYNRGTDGRWNMNIKKGDSE